MKFLELKEKIPKNIFNFLDVLKYFPGEKPQAVRVQLSRFAKKGLVFKIKKGIYCFEEKEIEEFALANYLYRPSYISLESALNFYGMAPDIPQTVTSVTPTTTKRITNQFGAFSYTKIKPLLFFGFMRVKIEREAGFFALAQKEKALLDYFYLRKIKETDDLRLNLKNLDKSLYQKYAQSYPLWVRKIRL